MYSSFGTPSTAATSSWRRQDIVVHTEPIPRARRASMKLHTAGMTDPHHPGWDPTRHLVRMALLVGDEQDRHLVEVVPQMPGGGVDHLLALEAGCHPRRRTRPERPASTRRTPHGRAQPAAASSPDRRPGPTATSDGWSPTAPAWRSRCTPRPPTCPRSGRGRAACARPSSWSAAHLGSGAGGRPWNRVYHGSRLPCFLRRVEVRGRGHRGGDLAPGRLLRWGHTPMTMRPETSLRACRSAPCG